MNLGAKSFTWPEGRREGTKGRSYLHHIVVLTTQCCDQNGGVGDVPDGPRSWEEEEDTLVLLLFRPDLALQYDIEKARLLTVIIKEGVEYRIAVKPVAGGGHHGVQVPNPSPVHTTPYYSAAPVNEGPVGT